MLSLLINTAGSHTTCGFLITPTAPLKRDNLQQKMPATKGTLQKNAKFAEIELTKGAKRNDLKKKIKKIALTTRSENKSSNSSKVRCRSCQCGMQVSIR